MHRLHLDPAGAAPAGVVGGGEVLHDDTLVARGEHVGEEGLGLGEVVGDDPGHLVGHRHQGLETRETLVAGGVEQVDTVEVQHVEEVRRDGDAGGHRRAGRRLLEGARPAGVVERQHLAVEHDRLDRERPHGLDHLGQPVGDVVERPGDDEDVVAGAVGLDADAVELGVDRHPAAAGLRDRVGEAGRAGGEHRQDGTPDLQPDLGQGGGALGEGGAGHGHGGPGEHRGPPDRRERDAGGGGERLLHQGVERPLPQLTGDQAAQPLLLLRRRPAEEVGHRRGAGGLRAAAGQGGDGLEVVVHLTQGQRRLGSRLGQVLQTPPAEAGAALEQCAAEVGDQDLDVVDRAALVGEAAQQVGERGGLGLAGAGGGHGGGGGDDVGEQHPTIVATGASPSTWCAPPPTRAGFAPNRRGVGSKGCRLRRTR